MNNEAPLWSTDVAVMPASKLAPMIESHRIEELPRRGWSPAVQIMRGMAMVIVIATGAGRNGIKLGPAMGRVAAALAAGNPPPLDVSRLGPARFAR
jgi:glycine/D-amino acid oxidase-like deaminating enzyme